VGACRPVHRGREGTFIPFIQFIQFVLQEKTVKYQIILASTFAALVAVAAPAGAGTLKGAAAGAAVGHFAGHHALAGAAVGAAVGHHRAHKKA
jgi:hypothetical protein